ncbi:MAG: class II aldolase/adducin family protein [Thermodesulfobacteriota bacterium]
MNPMFDFFEKKMVESGLVESGAPLFGFLDARLEWNRRNSEPHGLEELFTILHINSLLFSPPAEPYRTIIDYLAESGETAITPRDCETRTFLHDLPIAETPEIRTLQAFLKKRKGVVIPGYGIITTGSVSLEQAYITFSSICFACFVKFFCDFLNNRRDGNISPRQKAAFEKAVATLYPPATEAPSLKKGPFGSETEVLAAMSEAGKQVVTHRLVDSYFGNISCRLDGTLYISQTGSSLDNLDGCIDPCPLDGSSCTGLTASSELSAHMGIIEKTGCRTILHGHPPFAVILSMDCEHRDCNGRETCHLKCPHHRFVCGTPVVSGEVGTGPHGLCHTVPKVISEENGAIVHGHGLFTIGRMDFNQPFKRLLEIENDCRREFFRRVIACEIP